MEIETATKNNFYFRPWARRTLKKILPAPAIHFLVKVQNYFYQHVAFDHERAQKYELEHSLVHLRESQDRLKSVFEEFEKIKANKEYAIDVHARRYFFEDNQEKWESFAKTLTDKTCMEIGAGSVGMLTRLWWIKKRIIVEPLLNALRAGSLEIIGKTFFTDDMDLRSQNAEDLIPEFVGKIDGVIICTNAIDHADRPLRIIENIGKYAAAGCRLMFWSTLYYPHGHNEGHRNVMESAVKFEEFLKSQGFRIDHRVPQGMLPLKNEEVGYGCLATKI